MVLPPEVLKGTHEDMPDQVRALLDLPDDAKVDWTSYFTNHFGHCLQGAFAPCANVSHLDAVFHCPLGRSGTTRYGACVHDTSSSVQSGLLTN
jgi:hypothetical protein